MKKKRYYSDDFKVAIYLELLANTDPPVQHRGVSKKVAKKFDVPLRVVQSVWRKGQDLSHRVPGSTGSRNGDEERGTLISNCMEQGGYTASACLF